MRRSMLLAAGACLCTGLWSGTAKAKVEGRLSTYNVTSMYGEPKSLADALLFRLWLHADKISNRRIGFHLDVRSELDIKSEDGEDVFNLFCDGAVAENTACGTRKRRHAVLGDLDRIAGIYDAYLDLGGGKNRWALAIGRKTRHEAGAAIVDGF
jgi:hypothetical protein